MRTFCAELVLNDQWYMTSDGSPLRGARVTVETQHYSCSLLHAARTALNILYNAKETVWGGDPLGEMYRMRVVLHGERDGPSERKNLVRRWS